MGTPDEDRFAELFENHHRGLLAYAVRRVADPADAADVVAETFLVAWRRLDEVPPGPQARPWLFGVARRVLGNVRRGERRRLALAERLRTAVVDAVPPPDGGVSDVERAVTALGETDQEILRMHAWDELAHDEIALVLGLSRGAVRVRLHRARRRLAEQMAALAADPAGSPSVDDALPGRGVGDRVGDRKRAPGTGHVSGGWVPARPGVEEGS
jgi:RNA polymerase sigma-70 factor (ECF subfamily)